MACLGLVSSMRCYRSELFRNVLPPKMVCVLWYLITRSLTKHLQPVLRSLLARLCQKVEATTVLEVNVDSGAYC